MDLLSSSAEFTQFLAEKSHTNNTLHFIGDRKKCHVKFFTFLKQKGNKVRNQNIF